MHRLTFKIRFRIEHSLNIMRFDYIIFCWIYFVFILSYWNDLKIAKMKNDHETEWNRIRTNYTHFVLFDLFISQVIIPRWKVKRKKLNKTLKDLKSNDSAKLISDFKKNCIQFISTSRLITKLFSSIFFLMFQK